MSDHSRINRLALWLVVASGVGCAKNVVHPMSENREASLQPPARVLVYDPTVSKSNVSQSSLTGRPRDDRESIGQEAAGVFVVEMVDGINKLGLRAERAAQDTPVPDPAVLVTSELLAVDEGDESQRVMIGFGAGASRIDARVQVYYAHQGSRTTLLEFETHADSGKMPGTAATLGAGAVVRGGITETQVATSGAVGAAKNYVSAVQRMVAKNAEQATDYLSEYFGKHGWISQDRVHKAKR